MTTSNESPTFIFKIVPSNPPIPSPIPDALPVSELDRKSGFLHFSNAKQIPNTLKHFFASSPSKRDSVYLLRVAYAPLKDAGKVKWENPEGDVCGDRPGEGLFPHVYDGEELKLGKDDIESIREVVSNEGEDGWEKAIEKLKDEGWLMD